LVEDPAMPDLNALSALSNLTATDAAGISVQRLAQNSEKAQVQRLLPPPPAATGSDSASFSPEAMALLDKQLGTDSSGA
jgi:hypothetical protein